MLEKHKTEISAGFSINPSGYHLLERQYQREASHRMCAHLAAERPGRIQTIKDAKIGLG